MAFTFATTIAPCGYLNSTVLTPSRISLTGTETPMVCHSYFTLLNGQAVSCHGPPFSRTLGTAASALHQLNVTSPPVGVCSRYTGTVCSTAFEPELTFHPSPLELVLSGTSNDRSRYGLGPSNPMLSKANAWSHCVSNLHPL